MKVLFVGGTRFIGRAAVSELVAGGHDVVCLHRGNAPAPDGATEILGDRRAPGVLRQAIEQSEPEAVVDMILIRREDGEHLASACRGLVRRVVAISSADVYRNYDGLHGREPGEPDPWPLKEDAQLRTQAYPYRGLFPDRPELDDYDKIPVEGLLLDEPELRTAVLRLGMVYGPGDFQHRLYSWLRRMDDGRPHIVLGQSLAEWTQPHAFVAGVGRAIAQMAVGTHTGVFNVADRPVMTTLEWVQSIAKVVGWQGRVVVRPDAELPDVLRDSADFRFGLALDNEKLRATGWDEGLSLEERLDRAIAWERENPPPGFDVASLNYEAEDAAAG